MLLTGRGPPLTPCRGVGARSLALSPPTVPARQGFLKKGWGRPTILTVLPPGGRLPKPCRGSRAPAGRAGLSWPRVQLAHNHRNGRPTPTPGSSSATLPAKLARGQTPTVQFRSDGNPTRSYTPAPGKWRLSKAERLAQNHTAGKPDGLEPAPKSDFGTMHGKCQAQAHLEAGRWLQGCQVECLSSSAGLPSRPEGALWPPLHIQQEGSALLSQQEALSSRPPQAARPAQPRPVPSPADPSAPPHRKQGPSFAAGVTGVARDVGTHAQPQLQPCLSREAEPRLPETGWPSLPKALAGSCG